MPFVNLLRMSSALLACQLAAIVVIGALLLDEDRFTDLTGLATMLGGALMYAAPIGLLAGLSAEWLRLRQLAIQIALAVAVTFMAATLAVRNETMASPAFSGGAWTVAVLFIIAALAASGYWLIWGRYAGWRGDAVERADAAASGAVEAASVRGAADHCLPCLAIWGSLALTAFLLFGWGSLALSGLHTKLISDVEAQGNVALKDAGHHWARFSIQEERGVLIGVASSQTDAEAAQQTLRSSLASVTGIPGVIAGIDSIVTLREPVAPESTPKEQDQPPAPSEAAPVAAARPDSNAEAAQPEQAEATTNVPEPTSDGDGTEMAALPPPPPAEAVAPNDAPAASTETEPEGPGEPGEEAEKADAPPCNSEQLAIIKSSIILFERQRLEIASTYDGELERLAAATRACAPWALLISGYADSHGDNLFNERINGLRAVAVRESLIARGVSADLLVVKPAQNEAPHSAEDAPLDRRAEFRLVEPSKISRDATQDPSARAENCDSDLSNIMSQSIIHFATGSSQVSDQSLELIAKLAAAIQNCGSVVVMVEGHTDVVGTREQNQLLSDRRANSVRELLVVAGANPTRVLSRGYAATQPYKRANTAEAYALNRRIEFKVSGKFTSDNTGGP